MLVILAVIVDVFYIEIIQVNKLVYFINLGTAAKFRFSY